MIPLVKHLPASSSAEQRLQLRKLCAKPQHHPGRLLLQSRAVAFCLTITPFSAPNTHLLPGNLTRDSKTLHPSSTPHLAAPKEKRAPSPPAQPGAFIPLPGPDDGSIPAAPNSHPNSFALPQVKLFPPGGVPASLCILIKPLTRCSPSTSLRHCGCSLKPHVLLPGWSDLGWKRGSGCLGLRTRQISCF